MVYNMNRMPISTLQTRNNNSLYTLLIYFLALLGAGLLVYFGGSLINSVANLGAKSGLAVELVNGEGEVYVNGTKMGKTPFESSDIKPGDNTIKVQNAGRVYQTTIKFIKESKKVPFVNVKRDLGTSEIFSSGQNAWYEKSESGTVLSVITEPPGASVFIDGTEVGKTPYSSNNLTEDQYDLRIDYLGYEFQTARVTIQKGYNLNVSLKMFPMPVPSKVTLFEGSTNLYNVTLDNSLIVADTENWVKALLYWNQTRGVNLDGLGPNKNPVFDFLVDYKGNLYSKEGVIISSAADMAALKDVKRGAYLGRAADGVGLTSQARLAYEQLTKTGATTGKSAKVSQTPTGWLRVRDDASLNGKEIAKVNAGETYPVLEETKGWVKIKVSESISGWVSSDYVVVTF